MGTATTMKTNVRVRIRYSSRRSRHRQGCIIYVRIHLNTLSPEHARAKEVRAIRYYINASTGYYVCPNCNCTFEREYQSYCDRCGQKLAWTDFSNGKVILIKRLHPSFVKRHTPRDRNTDAAVLYSSELETMV